MPPALYELIEGLGANITANDTCIGTRFFAHDIAKTADPVDGLSKHYMNDVYCPRAASYGFEIEAYVLVKLAYIPYFPRNRGCLFSAKAATPSTWSSDWSAMLTQADPKARAVAKSESSPLWSISLSSLWAIGGP